MKVTRWAMTLGLALALAAVGFVALQGLPASAQDTQQLEPVVFSSNRVDDNYDIYVLDPETGLSTRLTDDPGNDIDPDWSPDGEMIVFASDRDGDYELYLMGADGSEVTQLTNNDADDVQPRFQPSGDYIVYVSDVNGQWDVFATTPDGMVRQLTNDVADERGPGFGEAQPGVQPTGPTAPLATATTAVAVPDGVVNSVRLNVRQNPGEGATILTSIPQGTPVDVLGRHPSAPWIQVQLQNGTIGWVYQPFVTLSIDLNSVPFVQAQFIAPPPTSTPAPTVAPTTAGPQQAIIEFWADRTTIAPGQCANLSWRVEFIREVYFQGAPAVGQETRQVCPSATTTYNLRVIRTDGVEDNRYITITVQ